MPVMVRKNQVNVNSSNKQVSNGTSFTKCRICTNKNDGDMNKIRRVKINKNKVNENSWETFPVCCECEDKYEDEGLIGAGQYGSVFLSKFGGKTLALKKIECELEESDGFQVSTKQLREMNILKKLNHRNIIKLIEVWKPKIVEPEVSNLIFYLVFEFCPHDLRGIIRNKKTLKFNDRDIKQILQQLFVGLGYMHKNKVLHRDLKPSNILVTRDGVLKIADFGLSRFVSSNENNLSNDTNLSNGVCALAYKPPELSLGSTSYDSSIDVWSAGCIMCELFTERIVFPGPSDQIHLNYIVSLCGSITPETWPNVVNLPKYNSLNLDTGVLRSLTDNLNNQISDRLALDLIDKILALDPSERLNSKTILNHNFFWTEPYPSDIKIKFQEIRGNLLSHLTTHQTPDYHN